MWLVDRFKASQGIDLARDKMAMQRLRESAERAKIELSSRSTATIDLPYIAFDRNKEDPLFLSETLSRAELSGFTSDLLDRSGVRRSLRSSRTRGSPSSRSTT